MLERVGGPGGIIHDPKLQRQVAEVNKLTKNDIIKGIAGAILTIGFVGAYVGITLKVIKLTPPRPLRAPFIWLFMGFLFTFPVFSSLAVTIDVFRPSRSTQALSQSEDKRFKAALCLSDHKRISWDILYQNFYKDFFEGKLDFIQPEDVTTVKLEEFFEKIKKIIRYYAVNQMDYFLKAILESQVLVDQYKAVRNEFINYYIDYIQSLNLANPDNQEIFPLLKRMSNLSTLVMKSGTLKFVEHLPNVRTLTIDAENLTETNGSVQNKSVKNLTIKNVKNVNLLEGILPRFAQVKSLTIECLEEVDQAKITEIVRSLDPSVKTFNFAAQNRPKIDFKKQLEGWAFKPEKNLIQFSRR